MPLRVALLVAGLAVGLLARTAATGLSFAAKTASGPTLLLFAGWSTMLAAVLSLSRPRRLTALLLYGGGAVWFIREFANPSVHSAFMFTSGLLLYAAGPALIAHLALSYPSGRLPGRPYLLIVVAGYLIMVGVLGLSAALVFDPEPMGCFGCPANLIFVHADPGRYEQLNRIGLWLGAAWFVVVAGAVGTRVLAASGAARRASAPVGLCAIGYLGSTAVYLLNSLQAGFLGPADKDTWYWFAAGVFLVLLAGVMSLDLWRNRRSIWGLTRSVIALAGSAPAGGLREILASRFRDPGLAIAYPIADGRYVDESARDTDLTLTAGQVVSALRAGNTELAVIIHRKGVLESPQQVDDLIASMHLGLENERLHAQALAQLQDLRSSGVRIIAAGDHERRRIERDLHDGAQQRLIGLLLSLRLLAGGLGQETPELATAEAELRKTIDELRRLAQGIYPVLLKDSGLRAALESLSETSELVVQTMPNRRYTDVFEATIYQLVEQLTARGPARVAVREQSGQIITTVAVTGHVEGLDDLAARASTMSGTLRTTTNGPNSEAILVMPLASGSRPP